MNDFLQKLNLKTPIIQAPMAGASDANFVIAACQAGALGSLGAGMMSAEQIDAQIRAIKSADCGSFLVNLMVLPTHLTEKLASKMPSWLVSFYDNLGVVADVASRPAYDFDEQFAVLLNNPVPVAGFTFGILTTEQVAALHKVGTLVVGTANHPDEAVAWANVGADAVIVQGMEAGGHRGGWLYEEAEPLPLEPLLVASRQALADAGHALPLVAAGGIATADSVRHYLDLGASAVAVGTAFLTTAESVIAKSWQSRLLAAKAGETALTRLYSGKLARGLVTDYMRQFAQFDGMVRHDAVPIYPTLNAMTKSLRAYGGQTGNTELMSLWAGVNVHHCQDETGAELVARLNAHAD
ncbi:NAD(P)H-dependent flavin oxidoreductase [Moraxella sp. ZJ142]|uniref:NAD(P)H-dependent flavin oxidoreductase n=1 Tax=Moraxella marmotae TaxID=3344520 RepID=UPI0035D476BF